MLENNFRGIFILNKSPMFYNFFGDETAIEIDNLGKLTSIKDVGLLIGLTPKIIPRPSDNLLVGERKKNEFVRIENLIGMRFPISDQSITSLV